MIRHFRKRRRLVVPRLFCVHFLTLATAFAGFAYGEDESEPNNDFGSSQVLPAGDLFVNGGELTPPAIGSPFHSTNDTLVSGVANSHDFVVTAGDAYTAYIDNTVDGADTTLQSLDELFTPLATDDDSSPVGNGLASALVVTGNPDGTLHFRVSGFDDFDFDGLDDGSGEPHGEAGDYSLFIHQGVILGDVDYFTFTGLTPGQSYIAETFADANGFTMDTVLGWFDNVGELIDVDDDGKENNLSRLEVTAFTDGTVNLSVSAFADFDFIGQHANSGGYILGLNAVPEPTGNLIMLLASIGIVFVKRGRRVL